MPLPTRSVEETLRRKIVSDVIATLTQSGGNGTVQCSDISQNAASSTIYFDVLYTAPTPSTDQSLYRMVFSIAGTLES